MKKSKKVLIVFIVLLAIIGTNFLTFIISNSISISKGDKVLISKEDFDLINQYKRAFDVRNIIENYYVDKGTIDESKLAEGAAKGVAESLGDPYTVYWTPKEYEENMIQTEGEYAGVGIIVEPLNGNIVVVSPIEDTPAYKAGIKSQDIIVKVDGKDVSGDKLDEAVSMMRGTPGTKVKITIYREGQNMPFDIELTRAKIQMKSVKGEMLDNKIGYIRISQFQLDTANEFKKALDDLKGNGMKGLIIDLRNNGGGLLDQCTKIADMLMGEGTIVYTIDYDNKKEVIPSDKSKLDLPLAILVNGGTASASEIVSGAVKDTNTGVLIGTKTFGKGLVQTVIPIKEDNSAVKITIARYYTPSGVCIQGKGIEPNINIDFSDELKQKGEITRDEDVQFKKAVEVIGSQIK